MTAIEIKINMGEPNEEQPAKKGAIDFAAPVGPTSGKAASAPPWEGAYAGLETDDRAQLAQEIGSDQRVPAVLEPYLEHTPALRSSVDEAAQTAVLRPVLAVKAGEAIPLPLPYIRVEPDADMYDAVKTIESIVSAATSDGLPVVCHIGPADTLAPLQSAMHHQIGERKPLVIGVEREQRPIPVIAEARMDTLGPFDPQDQSWAMLFTGLDVLALAQRGVQFDEVHFIAPPPLGESGALIGAGALLRPGGQLLVFTNSYWTSNGLAEIERGLEALGLSVITSRNQPGTALSDKIGATESRHINDGPNECHVITATRSLSEPVREFRAISPSGSITVDPHELDFHPEILAPYADMYAATDRHGWRAVDTGIREGLRWTLYDLGSSSLSHSDYLAELAFRRAVLEADEPADRLKARMAGLYGSETGDLALALSWAGVGATPDTALPVGARLADMESIIAYFETHPDALGSVNIVRPPKHREEIMTDGERIAHVAEALKRRQEIEGQLPPLYEVQLGRCRLGLSVNQFDIPPNGIFEVEISLSDFLPNAKPNRLGHLFFDVENGTMIIPEVHVQTQEMPRQGQKLHRQLRHVLSQGRERTIDESSPHTPGSEEAMILALREMLIASGILDTEAGIEILAAGQSLESRTDIADNGTETMMYRALGRTVIDKRQGIDIGSAGRTMIDRLSPDTQTQLWREIVAAGESTGAIEVAKALFDQIPEEARIQLGIATFTHFRQLRELQGLPFIEALKHAAMWTFDYRRAFFPYRTAFADLPDTPTATGRLISGTDLGLLTARMRKNGTK